MKTSVAEIKENLIAQFRKDFEGEPEAIQEFLRNDAQHDVSADDFLKKLEAEYQKSEPYRKLDEFEKDIEKFEKQVSEYASEYLKLNEQRQNDPKLFESNKELSARFEQCQKDYREAYDKLQDIKANKEKAIQNNKKERSESSFLKGVKEKFMEKIEPVLQKFNGLTHDARNMEPSRQVNNLLSSEHQKREDIVKNISANNKTIDANKEKIQNIKNKAENYHAKRAGFFQMLTGKKQEVGRELTKEEIEQIKQLETENKALKKDNSQLKAEFKESCEQSLTAIENHPKMQTFIGMHQEHKLERNMEKMRDQLDKEDLNFNDLNERIDQVLADRSGEVMGASAEQEKEEPEIDEPEL